MKLHPFDDVAAYAAKWIAQGATIFQQFNCAHCGAKQTMDVPNKFFEQGKCEECGKVTNIKRKGCNFLCRFDIVDPP
jgi:hypothetical protein